MTADRTCLTCWHPFHPRHIETHRDIATEHERRTRSCTDCVDCHPPEAAPIREKVKEVQPT